MSHYVAPRFSPITANLEAAHKKLRDKKMTVEDFLLLDFNENIEES